MATTGTLRSPASGSAGQRATALPAATDRGGANRRVGGRDTARHPASTHRALVALVALATGLGAYWLNALAREMGLAPEEITQLAGRAILGAAGKVELAPQLGAFPPIPYLVLLAAEWIARPLGLNGAALASAVLTAGMLATFSGALRRADYSWAAVALLVALFALNPLVLHSVARGTQALLMLWGVWMVGTGLFGLRATGGVNALLSLSLGLAVMVLTSMRGVAVAVAAVPFLLIAVPPDLRQRAFASVYLVLLFSMIFAGVFMMAISAVLLGGPFAFITPEMLETGRWSDRPLWAILLVAGAAGCGSAAIGIGLVLRAGSRRPVQAAALAMLGATMMAVMLQALFGVADSAFHALTVVAAAAAVFAVHWPREAHRTVRVAALLALGLAVSVGFIAAETPGPASRSGLLIGLTAHEREPGAHALGRWLDGKHGVMIHSREHPEVIAARGSAAGLVTATSPVFRVSVLSQRIFTDHVVVRAHRRGTSDDAISRAMPGLYGNGPPGYRLAYDSGGWRVWSRPEGQE